MKPITTNIVITRDFDQLASMIRQLTDQLEITSLVVATDPNTQRECYPLIHNAFPDALTPAFCCLPDGEQKKTLNQVTAMIDFLMAQGATRKTMLVNLGGGMLCDLGGFVAAIYKRGIHCLNIPTTLLAQVDAAVGGKTGVNYHGVKNLLGTFTMPAGVFVHPGFLATLPDNQWRSGLGELFKYGLIGSGIPLSDLHQASNHNPKHLLPLIRQAISFKEKITTLDPRDQGARRILNYGHTVGHALEAAALSLGQPILHGEAVAAGIVAETWLSVKIASLDPKLLDEVVKIYKSRFCKVNLPLQNMPALIDFMQHDKKNSRNGTINPVLLSDPGAPVFDAEVTHQEIENALRYLKSVTP